MSTRAVDGIVVVDAIDELVARSKPHRKLTAFHDFHRANPQVLRFLIEEIDLVISKGHMAFSFNSLWNYGRWKLVWKRAPGATFKMNDHLQSFYSRAIIIFRPDLNGRAELRVSKADEILGVEFESHQKGTKRYARRLLWADGTPLERGWRSTLPIVIDAEARRRPDVHKRSGGR